MCMKRGGGCLPQLPIDLADLGLGESHSHCYPNSSLGLWDVATQGAGLSWGQRWCSAGSPFCACSQLARDTCGGEVAGEQTLEERTYVLAPHIATACDSGPSSAPRSAGVGGATALWHTPWIHPCVIINSSQIIE